MKHLILIAIAVISIIAIIYFFKKKKDKIGQLRSEIDLSLNKFPEPLLLKKEIIDYWKIEKVSVLENIKNTLQLAVNQKEITPTQLAFLKDPYNFIK